MIDITTTVFPQTVSRFHSSDQETLPNHLYTHVTNRLRIVYIARDGLIEARETD